MHENNCVQFPQESYSTLHCLSLLCLETLTSHAAEQPNIPLKVSKSLATDLLIVV